MRRRSWKEFKGVAARVLPEEIRSSINPTGEVTFDIKTFQKMGEPQAMKLLYEEATRTIGLMPAHPDEANAVLVRVRHAKSSRGVRSKPCLKENNIDIPTTLRFPFPHIEDGVLILDLRTAVKWGHGEWTVIKNRRETKAANDEIRAERARKRAERKKELEDLRYERQRLSAERAALKKREHEMEKRDRERERENERIRRDLARELGRPVSDLTGRR